MEEEGPSSASPEKAPLPLLPPQPSAKVQVAAAVGVAKAAVLAQKLSFFAVLQQQQLVPAHFICVILV